MIRPALIVLSLGAIVALFVTASHQRPAAPVTDATIPASAGSAGAEHAAPGAAVETPLPLPPRNVTPPGIFTGPVRVPLKNPPAASEPQDRAEIRTYKRVIAEEAGRLSAGEVRIQLTGIVAPDPDSTCTDGAGQFWPCGRAAVAALRLLLRNRAIDCEIIDQAGGELTGDCSVGGRSISQWLVEQGWAEPADGSRYGEAAETAREGGRGMYATARPASPHPVDLPEPFRAPAIQPGSAAPMPAGP